MGKRTTRTLFTALNSFPLDAWLHFSPAIPSTELLSIRRDFLAALSADRLVVLPQSDGHIYFGHRYRLEVRTPEAFNEIVRRLEETHLGYL